MRVVAHSAEAVKEGERVDGHRDVPPIVEILADSRRKAEYRGHFTGEHRTASTEERVVVVGVLLGS